jgi:hypothetical protein
MATQVKKQGRSNLNETDELASGELDMFESREKWERCAPMGNNSSLQITTKFQIGQFLGHLPPRHLLWAPTPM